MTASSTDNLDEELEVMEDLEIVRPLAGDGHKGMRFLTCADAFALRAASVHLARVVLDSVWRNGVE